jgi:FtsP/CotA-like multicopper oxidase with cupredoxin domain
MNIVKNDNVYDDSTWTDVENEEEPWASPQINNITFHMPSSPLIFTQYPDQLTCNSESEAVKGCGKNGDEFCRCLHTLNVNYGDLVEIIIADGGSQEENHPIHLHGYSFAVLNVEKVLIFILIIN